MSHSWMADTENFLKTNPRRAIPAMFLSCLHCASTNATSIKKPTTKNQVTVQLILLLNWKNDTVKKKKSQTKNKIKVVIIQLHKVEYK